MRLNGCFPNIVVTWPELKLAHCLLQTSDSSSLPSFPLLIINSSSLPVLHALNKHLELLDPPCCHRAENVTERLGNRAFSLPHLHRDRKGSKGAEPVMVSCSWCSSLCRWHGEESAAAAAAAAGLQGSEPQVPSCSAPQTKPPGPPKPPGRHRQW